MQTPALILAALLSGSGVSAGSEVDMPNAYRDEILAFRKKRVERLTSDKGWLTVAGFYWLEPGENSFGTDPGNDLVLPEGSAPDRAGVFVHTDGRTTVQAYPGVLLRSDGKPIQKMLMRSDAEDTTDVIQLNDLELYVIERGGRYAIRMRDPNSPIRKNFKGIDTYPIQESYRVTARFEPYASPKRIPIINVVGTVDTSTCPGALVFELDGKEQRLDPLLSSPESKSFFLIFKDKTSGSETYAAGRFLYTDLPEDGRVTIDFNKAYNPPCAFSPFTTCPLPPRQNVLPIAIPAGEKDYAGR